ncbi:hypothetical protein LEP1GSC170_4652 [Leptospira interrogans serovar Bataviae str. HAI135]|nr:hypothetical protein LEP1GSC170_4652 [Leptospira interrogans serovar Bataviae str. HAI135]
MSESNELIEQRIQKIEELKNKESIPIPFVFFRIPNRKTSPKSSKKIRPGRKPNSS